MLRQRLKDFPELALPKAETTVIDERKFTEYIFGGMRTDGIVKGKQFNTILGYNINNYEILKDEVLEALLHYPSKYNKTIEQGMRYDLVVIIKGVNGNIAPVKVGVCVKPNGNSVNTMLISMEELRKWLK